MSTSRWEGFNVTAQPTSVAGAGYSQSFSYSELCTNKARNKSLPFCEKCSIRAVSGRHSNPIAWAQTKFYKVKGMRGLQVRTTVAGDNLSCGKCGRAAQFRNEYLDVT